MSVNDLIKEGVSLFKSNNFDQAIAKFNQALDEIEDKKKYLQEQSDIQFWLGRCYLEPAMKAKDVVEVMSFFARAIMYFQEQLKLAKQLTNEQTSILEQIYAQFWLGRCYLEQAMKVKDIREAKDLFAQAVKRYQEELKLAEQLTDEQTRIQQQIYAQHWLGRCYFEQAMKAKDIAKAKDLFAKAVKYHQEELNLTEQLTDEQTRTQEQVNAQFWLGRCYLEQAMKAKDIAKAKDLFAKAVKYHQEELNLAEQLTDEQTRIQKQIYAQSWLGRCYLEQAMKVKDIAEAKDLFAQAIEYHQEWLKLAEQLTDEQTRIQKQINAHSWLGGCYFEQARKVKDITEAKDLFTKADEHNQERLKLTEQLSDEQTRIQKQNNAQSWIDRCHRNISFLEKNWPSYWEKKKQDIRNALFSNMSKRLDKEFEDAVSTILAVLNIPPIELGSIPLAHYTSSTVCNKLFGVVNEDDPSPMRIGSSTYMNDPSEGKGLLELLSLQDLELENKVDCSSHNAFFACFSSRVNDLNQFRLYGKEDGVEASGCCLVFNKNGDWLKVPDISAPFRSITKNQDENLAEFKETDISNVEYENLPLYQVAYIAYKDEYITKEKCEIWLYDFKFGICLKPIGENKVWHNFRLDQLKEALQELVGFFKEKDHVNDKNKNALEYIRYLFKDFAFRDEEEFRVLKMAEIGSEEIEYCKTTKSIYLPYADISNVVDEVILGTNYEKTNSRHKAEVFQHQMKQKCPYVRVSRSSLPIYANPPIKKD